MESEELFVSRPVVGSQPNSIGISDQSSDSITIRFHIEDDGYGNIYPLLDDIFEFETGYKFDA